MNKKFAIFFLASAALLSGCGDETPKSLEEQIDDKCHVWANKVRSTKDYISNRFNGCQIAYMENTPSLKEKGAELVNSLPENSETRYYADQISLCLNGFTC